jgi:hypothetical protein
MKPVNSGCPNVVAMARTVFGVVFLYGGFICLS